MVLYLLSLLYFSPDPIVNRNFVRSQYKHVKALNPSTPILIREHPGEEARLIATYGYGVERKVIVDGMDETGVERELKNLVAAGDMMKRK